MNGDGPAAEAIEGGRSATAERFKSSDVEVVVGGETRLSLDRLGRVGIEAGQILRNSQRAAFLRRIPERRVPLVLARFEQTPRLDEQLYRVRMLAVDRLLDRRA